MWAGGGGTSTRPTGTTTTTTRLAAGGDHPPAAPAQTSNTTSSSFGSHDPSSSYLQHEGLLSNQQQQVIYGNVPAASTTLAFAPPRFRFAPDPTLVALIEQQKQLELAAALAAAAATNQHQQDAASVTSSTSTSDNDEKEELRGGDKFADAEVEEEQQQQAFAYAAASTSSTTTDILSMPPNKTIVKKIECVCGRKKCGGVTAIFQVLQDRRGCFVELPPTEIERTLHFLQDDDNDGQTRQKKLHELDDSEHIPSRHQGASSEGFMSSKEITWQLRAAYLRHLNVDNESVPLRPDDDGVNMGADANYYVALHHFHPQVVQDSYVVEGDDRLAVVCRSIHESSWKSLYLNLNPDDRIPGTESSYFVVPNYDFAKAKDDAQRAFSRFRLQQHGNNVQSVDGDAMFVRTVVVPPPDSAASVASSAGGGGGSRSGSSDFASAVVVPPSPTLSNKAAGAAAAAPSAVPWAKLIYHPKDAVPASTTALSSTSLETASGLARRTGSNRNVSARGGDVRRASSSAAVATATDNSGGRGRGRSIDPTGTQGMFGYRGRSQGPTEGRKRGTSLTRMFRGRSASSQRTSQPDAAAPTNTGIDAKNDANAAAVPLVVASGAAAAAQGPTRGRSTQQLASTELAVVAAKTPRARSPLRALSPFRRQRSQQPTARSVPVVVPKASSASTAPKSKIKVIPVNSSAALPSSHRGVSVTRVSQQPRPASSARASGSASKSAGRSGSSVTSSAASYSGPVDLDEKLSELNAASSKSGDVAASSKFAKYVPAPLDRKTLRQIRKGLIKQSSDGSLEVDLDDIMEAPSDDDESTVATVQRKRAAGKPKTVVVVPRTPTPPKAVDDEAPAPVAAVVAASTADVSSVPAADELSTSEEVGATATIESCEDVPISESVPSDAAPDAEFPLGPARQLTPPVLDDENITEPASDGDGKEEPAIPSGEEDVPKEDQDISSSELKENSESPEVAASKEESLEPEDTPEQTELGASPPSQGDESEAESAASMALVATAAAAIVAASMSDADEPAVVTTSEAPAEVSVPSSSTIPFEEASEHSTTSYGCNPFDDEEPAVHEVDSADALAESPTPRSVNPFDSVALEAPSAAAYSPSTNPFDDQASSAYAAAAKTPSPTKQKTMSSPSSDFDATEATVESTDFDSSYEEPAAGESPVASKEPRMNLFALTKVEEEVVKEYRLPEGLKPLIELSEMPTDRTESMVVFAAIEAKRRGWATSELRGFKEQWGCYKDLIPAMARETEWVEDLLKTAFKSIEAYASMMRAVSSDTLLDEADRIVTDQKKRAKIASKRAKEVYNYPPADPSIMQPVIDMLVAASNQLDESAPALTTEVESMSELSAQVSSSGSDLAKAGDRIMLDMDCMETKILSAWAHLENVDRDLEGNEDHWLAEASYRNTVREGCTLFKTHYAELMKICERIIALDEERRSRTKEILLSFLPRRRRVFLRVLEATQPSITALEDGRLGRDEINAEVDQVIEHITRQSLSKQKRSRSSILNRSLSTKLDLKVEIDLSAIAENKMFESSHVKELRAVEAKITSKAQWQLSLAVITHDGFLHIVHCDLPESQLKEFQESKQRAENFLSSKCENRTPDVSIPLLDCRSKMSSKKECIEITVDGSSPLQMMLKRKVCIRLGTPTETSRWFEAHDAFWSRRGEEASSPRVSRV